ncbi:MAG: diacylglycerol kinase family protein [Chromatocurvus sp.]
MSVAGARIGVISNPASGHNRDHFPAVQAAMAGCSGLVLHAVTDSASDIPQALRELASSGADTLIINGGDGTVSAVIGRLLEGNTFAQTPLIAVLPAGTANMTAGDVGVRGRLQAAVKRVCRWAAQPAAAQQTCERRERRLLRLDMDGAVHHGMFLGSGAIISGTDYAHREIHARGLRDDASLALTTLRTVWGLLRNDPAFTATTPVSLSIDGAPTEEHDALILALSTLHRLSFGMRPFWGHGDGALRLTLVDRDCRHFLPNFVNIIRGRPGRGACPGNGYHSVNADALCMHMAGAINLDGEVLTPAGPLRITPSAPVTFLRL